jgi:hypothetical protein
MLLLTCTLSIERFIIDVYTKWTRIFLFEAKKTKRRSTGQNDVDILHKGPHFKAQLHYSPLIHKISKSTSTFDMTTLVRAPCCVSFAH